MRKGLVGRLGRGETRKGAKDVGKGKERKEVSRPFSPPIVLRALTIFLIITGISSGIPAEEKGRDENTTEDKLMTLTSRKD